MNFGESWDRFLSEERPRQHPMLKRSEIDGRNEFESDYSRVVFSSPFRRLQDKTQVFPLASNDFVRTRLTHSMEVSSVARSIGLSVERELSKRHNYHFRGRISSVLAVAGLAHDLGNPPFGHFGEEAIRSFFKKYFEDAENQIRSDLSSQQLEYSDIKADFEHFDGNAQTFRLLSKLQYLKDENGMNLTYGTLATMIKYPWTSTELLEKIKQINGDRSLSEEEKKKSTKKVKLGCFQSEKERLAKVKDATRMENNRHPLSFILEAADDIAYSAGDIEDGLKSGLLAWEDLKPELDLERQELLPKNVGDKKDNNYDLSSDISGQLMRVAVQSFMIESVVESFLDHEEEIRSGTFDGTLLKESKACKVHKFLKDTATEYVFNSKGVIERELAGETVIQGLLKAFVEASTNLTRTPRHDRYYSLISPNYRFVCDHYPFNAGKVGLYDKLLLATDFVCGMTDTYAMDLYRKISGIKL